MMAPISYAEDKAAKPMDIVNKRISAHNEHDLETFLSVYSDEIQVYDYPDIPLGSAGRDHIRKIFAPLFEEKSVTTEVHHQIEHGKYVINHETVTRQGKTTKYVSIYEVQNGLIQSVRFIREY